MRLSLRLKSFNSISLVVPSSRPSSCGATSKRPHRADQTGRLVAQGVQHEILGLLHGFAAELLQPFRRQSSTL